MTHASPMPEERPRRHLEDEAIADEATFTEESPVDEEGYAITEEEQAESGEPRPKRRGRISEEEAA